MNLENLNLVELNAQEMLSTEGGGKGKAIITAIKKAAHEIGDFFQGLYDGFND